jgi:uncharacterized protein (TIGR02271 family)
MSTTTKRYEQWIGQDAFDRSGDKIGSIDNVYLDTETGRPEWVAVNTGLFGMNTNLAPIVGSQVTDDGVQLDVEKDTVKDAPHVGEDRPLEVDEERRLYEHYQIDLTGGADAYFAEERQSHGYQVDRRADDGYEVDEAALTRREEELEVGKHKESAGKVRLRKYVTTEMETVTVPVEKERVVVERESASGKTSGKSSGKSSGKIGDESVEMELEEDVIDVDKRVVDKETVRAGKQKVTETEKVQAEVRKEQVDVEGDADVKKKR